MPVENTFKKKVHKKEHIIPAGLYKYASYANGNALFKDKGISFSNWLLHYPIVSVFAIDIFLEKKKDT